MIPFIQNVHSRQVHRDRKWMGGGGRRRALGGKGSLLREAEMLWNCIVAVVVHHEYNKTAALYT